MYATSSLENLFVDLVLAIKFIHNVFNYTLYTLTVKELGH